jgi:transcriptional regulator with XRE-family HTH domain
MRHLHGADPRGGCILVGLAGLSPSFVSMVENGQRPLDRRSRIAGLASALNVSEIDLMGGPHLTPDPVRSDPHKGSQLTSRW